MSEQGIGASVRRSEDQRFLTGKGNYVDDINRPGQAYAAFVRSPHAHAKIKSIKTDKAAKAPGVLTVLTGQDWVADGLGPMICGVAITDRNGEPHKAPPHSPLSPDTAKHVGDEVAVVIAETLAQAREAAELVDVNDKELPCVTSTAG